VDESVVGPEGRRFDDHRRLRMVLEGFDDSALTSLVLGTAATWRAWGASHVVSIDGASVFVKRIPVTDREMARVGSTRNCFGLPGYYSYGVGSAGFGAFRELAAMAHSTRLVADGGTAGVPLLHHHRVLSRHDAPPPFPMEADTYIAYWNNNRQIAGYFQARQDAHHELWTLSEYAGNPLDDWLPTHQDRTEETVTSLCATLGVLHSHGISHFDAHFGNVLTDGEAFYLSDFGLALSRDFELTAIERRFLERHWHYDFGSVLWCLGHALRTMFQTLPNADKESLTVPLGHPEDDHQLLVALLGKAESIATAGAMLLEAHYLEALDRYHDVIVYMDRFLLAMRHPHKNARYHDPTVERLLLKAGAPIG
jgi:hypothetical protein